MGNSKEVQSKKERILDILDDLNVEVPFKAFLAISNTTLRQELLKRLSTINVDCNVALQKKSIP